MRATRSEELSDEEMEDPFSDSGLSKEVAEAAPHI